MMPPPVSADPPPPAIWGQAVWGECIWTAAPASPPPDEATPVPVADVAAIATPVPGGS